MRLAEDNALGHFYFLLGLVALLALSLGLSLHRRFGRRGRFPFVAAPTLFPPAQLALFEALEGALGPDYRLFGRIRALDVIGLRPRLGRATRRRALTLLWERRFDVLICTARDNRIAAAVNLAPPSRTGRAPPRDTLDRICAAAGLPFLRIRETGHYDPALLRNLVQAAIASHRRASEPTPEPARPRSPSLEPEHRLTDPVLTDAREPRLRPVRRPPVRPAPAPALAPVPAPAPALAPVLEAVPPPPRAVPAILAQPAPRIEPVLAPDGDLDPGPAFHIGGHLEDEDERPLRMRRR